MPKDKPTWGGRRPNQTGRPTSRKGVRRVHLTASVDPSTDKYLKDEVARGKKSIGQAIDDLIPKGRSTS